MTEAAGVRRGFKQSCAENKSPAPIFLNKYPDLLNVGHMCEITGLSSQTIRSECAKGSIPAVRIGRRWFVPKVLLAEHVGAAYGR